MKEGWTYKKLGEVCENLRTGLNPRVHFKLNTENAKGYYVTVRELKGFTFEVDNKTDRIDEYAIKRINERSNLKVGDVLYSGTGTIGRTALVQELPTWWNIKEGVYALTPKHDILDSSFLIYAMHSEDFSKKVLSRTSGATVRSIPMKELKEVTMVIPPLCEQQRIVSRLDSAFAHIDERKANAEKQLSEARALFQTALTKAMEPKEGWEEKKMKEIVVSLTDGDHQPPPKSNDGIPFITISNIDKDANRIDFENTFFVPRSYFEGLKKDRIPHEGDVLYTVTGSFGIPVLIDFQKEFCFQRHIALIRPNQNRLSSKFLYYWILSSYATTQAEDTATGTAQRTVSLNSLRNFVITIPPLSEQQRIVSRLDSLSAHVRELEEVLQKTIAECDALKQALLRKVFE